MTFGEFIRGQVDTMRVWAARLEFDVTVTPTEMGRIETGESVYLIRWLDVAFTLAERDRNAKPAITALHDEVGSRNIVGVGNWPGYRGSYLVVRCAGTR